MTARHLEYSRTFPVDVEDAYDRVLSAPLPKIFARRYLAIAPIAEVSGEDGEWGAATGQSRTIRMQDNGTMLETLTSIERPNHFGYTIGDITGPMKPLVAEARGVWAFEPAGTGVRITWSWDVTPTARLGRLAMPVFARLWQGNARQAFDAIERLLVPA
jgi:hypothetical protein